MVKLVCPVCSWSDFLKYDCDDFWFCLCCGMEYSDSEVKKFEKDVPESEFNGYGATIINVDKEDSYNEFMAHYDEHYAKYMGFTRSTDNSKKTEDESDWQALDEPSPFEYK